MKPASVFPKLYGNDALKSLLGKDIAAGSYAHAYILEGPPGSGRHTAARQIAAAVCCESIGTAESLPCGQCLSCRKIARGLSPDFICIGAGDKSTIGVEEIRGVKENLYIPPNDTDHKVYLLEDADRLTVQAQNAFLLSLEEPPSFVLFLLLVTDAGKLLPTVRSRAPVLRMQQFPAEKIREYLAAHPLPDTPAPSADTLRNASALAGGCIGQAYHFLEAGRDLTALGSRRTVADQLAKQLLAGSPAEGVRLLNILPKKREDVRTLLQLVLTALRDFLAVKKADNPPLTFYADPQEILELTRTLTPARVLSACDAVVTALEDLEANGSVPLLLTALLLSKTANTNGRTVR